MRKLVRFGQTPLIQEVSDEEFAEWERNNATAIETRRIMRSHDEAQALLNARLEGRRKWQDVVADNDAEIARLRAQHGKIN